MKNWLHYIPLRVKLLALQLTIVWSAMLLTRVIFHIANSSSFTNVGLFDYIVGAWFDAVTIGLLFLPYVIFYLLPFNVFNKRWHQLIARILFLLTTIVVIGFNLMDVEYFKYTSKRSTIDLWSIVSAGSDMQQLALSFITDFWWIILLFIVLVVVLFRFSKRLFSSEKKEQFHFGWSLFSFAFYIGLMIFIGRGGIVFKPVGVLDAARYSQPGNTALVLNTPFTLIKSIGSESLKEVSYFTDLKQTEKYFNPIKKGNPQHLFDRKQNVVILILESFGQEFIGFYNREKSYTPFLDSLLKESWTFSGSFANGKKSIEAVPSLFLSIPSLQDNPYISSPYNSNRVIGLPEFLKKYGYESAFYHGATNGSMRFDSFSQFIGFDHYVGRKEYNNESHSDGNWGILDEYFNPWTAKQLSTLKEPFLASLFTLSSHHPFYVPSNRQKEVVHGPQPICASISYADLSLRLFFEEAKKQKWYDNTVFVLCADHTPGTQTPEYNQRTQTYQIPIAFYHPGGKLPKERQNTVAQQIDIYPTLVDLLDIDAPYYSFGQSLFDTNDSYSISYLEGSYYYFENNEMLVFSQNQARFLYDYTIRSNDLVDLFSTEPSKVKKYENRVKAIIQRYNHDLIHNKTTAK
jgi:phosphoglycerol transferase MdoB-like AlkP superfamily enzyme